MLGAGPMASSSLWLVVELNDGIPLMGEGNQTKVVQVDSSEPALGRAPLGSSATAIQQAGGPQATTEAHRHKFQPQVTNPQRGSGTRTFHSFRRAEGDSGKLTRQRSNASCFHYNTLTAVVVVVAELAHTTAAASNYRLEWMKQNNES